MNTEDSQPSLQPSAIRGLRFIIPAVFAIAIFAPHGELRASDHKFPEWPATGATATNATSSNTTSASSPSGANTAQPALTNSMSALDDKYRLSIGDKLSFRIVEDEEEAKPLVVTDSGELEVPYLGRFPAVGKTCLGLARALKAELEKDYYYQATVIVAVDNMTKSRGRVYLVGPIRSPGPQEVPNDEVLTLSKAILRAGGFTDYADKRHVKVTRKNAVDGAPEEVFTVNVEDVLEKGKIESDLPLRAGDLIYVPERLVRF